MTSVYVFGAFYRISSSKKAGFDAFVSISDYSTLDSKSSVCHRVSVEYCWVKAVVTLSRNTALASFLSISWLPSCQSPDFLPVRLQASFLSGFKFPFCQAPHFLPVRLLVSCQAPSFLPVRIQVSFLSGSSFPSCRAPGFFPARV